MLILNFIFFYQPMNQVYIKNRQTQKMNLSIFLLLFIECNKHNSLDYVHIDKSIPNLILYNK